MNFPLSENFRQFCRTVRMEFAGFIADHAWKQKSGLFQRCFEIVGEMLAGQIEQRAVFGTRGVLDDR